MWVFSVSDTGTVNVSEERIASPRASPADTAFNVTENSTVSLEPNLGNASNTTVLPVIVPLVGPEKDTGCNSLENFKIKETLVSSADPLFVTQMR